MELWVHGAKLRHKISSLDVAIPSMAQLALCHYVLLFAHRLKTATLRRLLRRCLRSKDTPGFANVGTGGTPWTSRFIEMAENVLGELVLVSNH